MGIKPILLICLMIYGGVGALYCVFRIFAAASSGDMMKWAGALTFTIALYTMVYIFATTFV